VELAWDAELLSELDRRPPWLRYRLLDTLTFLPSRMLAKVDGASMRVALEVRVPLLDHRLVELLLSLPPSLSRSKGVLRRVTGRLASGLELPRRKIGFELPLAHWLRNELRDAVEKMLAGGQLESLGMDIAVLQRVWEAHRTGRADHAERLLAVMALGDWVSQLGEESSNERVVGS
jgi:asparagine synthase (glutamine-hydrolysing)